MHKTGIWRYHSVGHLWNKIHVKRIILVQVTLATIVGDDSVARPLHSKSGLSSVATIHQRSDMNLPHRLAKALHEHVVSITLDSSPTAHVIKSHSFTNISVSGGVLSCRYQRFTLCKNVKGRISLYVAFHVMAGRPVAAHLTWLSEFTQNLSTLDCGPLRYRRTLPNP